MELIVKRDILSPDSVTGKLFLDGKFQCYTLEPPAREDKPHCIPAGTYELTLRQSPRFHRVMPHVESVPGFDGILIHWGNYPTDTIGCVLVGLTRSEDFIGSSKVAFAQLYEQLTNGKITFLDPPDTPSTPRSDSSQ